MSKPEMMKEFWHSKEHKCVWKALFIVDPFFKKVATI
jgi:hypothetical protein